MSLALPGGTGTRVGSLGLSAVYGLSRAGDNVIYANSNNSIYSVDAATGATTFLSSYTYAGASAAYGTSFLFEAGVPEPATWAMMIAGFGPGRRRDASQADDRQLRLIDPCVRNAADSQGRRRFAVLQEAAYFRP